MSVVESPGSVEYRSKRRSGGCYCDVDATVGQALAQPIPGSLEFFLVERYLLYSVRGNQCFTGRVFHKPYSVQSANVTLLRENLVAAAGIQPKQFVHTLYSPGVEVEVFRLRPEA